MISPDRATSTSASGYMRWIAGLNLFKGLILLLLACGLLGFLHKDVDVIVARWLSHWGWNLENRHIATLLDKLELITDRQLSQWSCLTFVFAGVFITEGAGLWMKQRWAEYLTLVATSSLIPFELFETCRHFSAGRLALLTVNLIVVAFLGAFIAKRVRQERAHC